MENLNTPKYLDDIKTQVLRILDDVEIAPGAQIFTGQTGTSQIPDAMDITTDVTHQSKGTLDTSRGSADSRHTANSEFAAAIDG
jgi:hypothetical protein